MTFEVILKAGRKVEEVCVSLQQEYKWVFGRSKCFRIKNKKFKKVAKHSSELSIDIMIEENTFKSTKRFKMKKKCFKLNAKFLFFVEKIMIYYLIFFLSLFRYSFNWFPEGWVLWEENHSSQTIPTSSDLWNLFHNLSFRKLNFIEENMEWPRLLLSIYRT
jgi:hypothetical protein